MTWVVADLLAFALLLLASTTFAICCWSRQWLLYPNYNYLSWYGVNFLVCKDLLEHLEQNRTEHNKL